MAEIPFGVNSLKISNINILNKTSDPRIVGDSSPVNSVYYRDNGEIYFKFNTGNTDWELIHPKETKDITANYTILRTNSNLIVNTTSSNITLTLPDVSTLYKSKEYYFKKTSGNNSLIINPHSGQTIDGESSKTLTDLNESTILIYVDNNNWTTKSSGATQSSEFTITPIKTSNYTGVISDLILIDTTTSAFTIELPIPTSFGQKIAIKDVGGSLSNSTKRLTIDAGEYSIDYGASTFILKENFTYLELLYNETNNWIVVNKTVPNYNEFDETLFKIYKTDPSSTYVKFQTFDDQQLTIKTPNISTGNYTIGDIPTFSATEQYYVGNFIEYGLNLYKCNQNYIGTWNPNYFDLLAPTSERIEKKVFQTSHGFVFGNLIKFSGSSWGYSQSSAINGYSLGIVSEVIDVNNFKVCFSGYLNGFTGLTVNNLYYLSEFNQGEYTTTKGETLKQPVFYAISSTEAIVLPWSPSIEDLLTNYEYIISNNGVLDYTTKTGLFKVIQKNNISNEIDIRYSITNTYVDLVVKNMSTMFSGVKDTTDKVNIYVETATVKIQNLTGSIKTFIIKKII